MENERIVDPGLGLTTLLGIIPIIIKLFHLSILSCRTEDGSVVRGADYRRKGPWFESLAWHDQTFTQRGESPALCNSGRRNHEVWSHREEGPGHCSISIASQCPKNYLRMLRSNKYKIQVACYVFYYSKLPNISICTTNILLREHILDKPTVTTLLAFKFVARSFL